MNILIIEAYSAANVGSGALVENSVRLLEKNFPGAEIEVLAQNPASIHKLTGLSCYDEIISLPLRQPRLKQSIWLLKTGLWMAVRMCAAFMKSVGINKIPAALYTFDARKLTALKKIQRADLVVSVGAERINDNFYKAILFSLYMLWIVQVENRFLVLFPQTIGPFHFRLTRFLSAKILNKCNVVFLRDRKSRDIVNSIGVSNPLIIDTCDVAILQPAISTKEAWGLLNECGLNRNGNALVGISAMKWDYIKAVRGSCYDDYKNAIATVADELIETQGVQILFLATNVRTEGCREDDVTVGREISTLMRNQNDVFVLDKMYTPSQMKGMMGVLELCLVTRMHACIFSTGVFTPTVSINYQFKLKEYMKLVGLGEYTVDIDSVSVENLRALVNLAWRNRIENRETLKSSITSWCSELKSEMARLPEYHSFWDRNKK